MFIIRSPNQTANRLYTLIFNWNDSWRGRNLLSKVACGTSFYKVNVRPICSHCSGFFSSPFLSIPFRFWTWSDNDLLSGPGHHHQFSFYWIFSWLLSCVLFDRLSLIGGKLNSKLKQWQSNKCGGALKNVWSESILITY